MGAASDQAKRDRASLPPKTCEGITVGQTVYLNGNPDNRYKVVDLEFRSRRNPMYYLVHVKDSTIRKEIQDRYSLSLTKPVASRRDVYVQKSWAEEDAHRDRLQKKAT